MEQAAFQTRWGDSQILGVVNGSVFPPNKQLVQIAETYGRAWVLRLFLSSNRPLVVGEQVNARFAITEGVGSSLCTYTRTLTIDNTVQTVGPLSEDLAFVQLSVNVEFLNSGVLTPATISAQAWACPVTPVYPLPRGTNG